MKAASIFSVKLLALGLAALPIVAAHGQQLPLFALYRENWALLNPAGLSNHYLLNGKTLSFGVTYRRQWVGLEDAPRTAAAQAEVVIPKWRVATGGTVVDDRTGAMGRTAVHGKFAYLIAIGGRQAQTLSIGLAAGAVQYRVNPNDVQFRDPGDVVAGTAESRIVLDVGLGIFYHYADRFYAGVSIPQLLGSEAEFRTDGGSYALEPVRHFYAAAGGYFNLAYSGAAFLEPSVWLRYVGHAPFSADFNLRYQFNETFWLGAGGGTSKMLHLEFGLVLAQQIHLEKSLIKIGLGFDRQLGALGPDFGDSYECTVTVALDH